MNDPMFVDLFAGGGGASEGFRMAFGRGPDVAVDHCHHAIQMHALNHPETHHEEASVWEIRPEAACQGKEVDILWLSPDCRHFSRAKGSPKVSPRVRTLARVAIPWARTVRPRVIALENVHEFLTWGPLKRMWDPEEQKWYWTPDKARAGQYFRKFVEDLQEEGYQVDWRILNAAEFGAPTSRERLFLVARLDEQPKWPTPTHGPRRRPYRTAAECIDWEIPVRSIFGRKKPLAEATQRRLAAGLVRFVLNNPRPFIVNLTHGGRLEDLDKPLRTITGAHRGEKAIATPFIASIDNRSSGNSPVRATDEPLSSITTKNRHGLVAATWIPKHYGTSVEQDLTWPMSTITAGSVHQGLCTAWIAKHFTGATGQQMELPLATITATDHNALCLASQGDEGCDRVVAWLERYYSEGGHSSDLQLPMPTITTVDRMSLVIARVREMRIVDVGMRMLQPHELLVAQSFPSTYKLTGTNTQKTARIGNSVPPQLVEAILRENARRKLSKAA